MSTKPCLFPRLALALAACAGLAGHSLFAAEPEQTATAAQPSSPDLFDRMGSMLQPVPGLQFQMVSSNEVFGNVSGGTRRGAIFEGLLQAGVQADLAKLVGWEGASFKAYGYYAYGPGLSQRYTHDLSTVSNIDAYDSLRLDEIWLQQELWDQHFSLRAGLLAFDTEFIISESGALFLNSTFAVPAGVSANFQTPIFPLSAPGVRLAWDSKEAWLVRCGAYSGDLGTQDRTNRHGTRFAFSSESGGIFLGEAVRKLSFSRDGQALPGSFKIGGFYDSGRFDDLNGAPARSRGCGGGYLILDQALYRERKPPGGPKESGDSEQGLNCFCRVCGAGPDEHALLTWYGDAGITYKGLLPGRADDSCGLAFAYLRTNDQLASSDPGSASRHEAVIEATYQASFGKHLTVQPDCQCVFNPGATAKAATAVVLGVRCALTF